ncbi:MAG: hypothetical protein ACRC5N_03385, partial [Plesiomonas sp.]
LAGKSPTVELNDQVLIGGDWLEAIYSIDLNAYFAKGLDRNDLGLTIIENCDFDGENIGEYDVLMSKALDTAMCKVEQSKVKDIYQNLGDYIYSPPFYFIGTDNESNQWWPNYAQGITMRWSVDIKPTQSGDFSKIFTSCKGREPGHHPEQEWKVMSCDTLISSTLTNM